MEKKHYHAPPPPPTFLTTKKIFFYNFIPSKLEEEHCKLFNKTYLVTKSIIKIRDVSPAPYFDPVNPWHIKRTLMSEDITSSQIYIKYNEAFDYVFRYWSLEMVNAVVMLEKKLLLVVWDLSDENKPVNFSGEAMFLEKGCDEGYNLGILELLKSKRSIKIGDEIGLYWDVRASAFMFKVLRSSSNES